MSYKNIKGLYLETEKNKLQYYAYVLNDLWLKF